MVTGYQHFEEDVNIAGVILNHVSGSRNEGKLRDALERHCHIPVVGSVPRDEGLRISERHLGLIPSEESCGPGLLVERIGRSLEPHLDVDQILKIAQSAGTLHPLGLPAEASAEVGVRGNIPKIGIIRDTAQYLINLP